MLSSEKYPEGDGPAVNSAFNVTSIFVGSEQGTAIIVISMLTRTLKKIYKEI